MHGTSIAKHKWHGIVAALAAVLLAAGTAVMTSAGTAPRPPMPRTAEGGVLLTQCRVLLVDELTLSSERSGVLDFVAAEGTAVEEGEIVAHTRDDVVRATVAIAERQAGNDVEVRFAKKSSELAQLEYESDLAANQTNPDTIPEFTVRQHRLAAEKALLQLEQAEHNLQIERLQLAESREVLGLHRVRAPFAAVVRQVHKKRGESVREGDPVLELVNTERIRVEGDVALADLPRVKVGAPVQVRIDVPDADLDVERLTFTGRIAFIDVKVEPISRRVRVWAEVANRDGALKDGLSATMLIAPEPAVGSSH